jgi:hypothetical protein
MCRKDEHRALCGIEGSWVVGKEGRREKSGGGGAGYHMTAVPLRTRILDFLLWDTGIWLSGSPCFPQSSSHPNFDCQWSIPSFYVLYLILYSPTGNIAVRWCTPNVTKSFKIIHQLLQPSDQLPATVIGDHGRNHGQRPFRRPSKSRSPHLLYPAVPS